MFEKISNRLPAYHEHYVRLLERRKQENVTSDRSGRPTMTAMTVDFSGPSHERALKALSLVYADIIQFCQEACKIFSSKKGGKGYFISANILLYGD
jgi:hypothetical protein